MAAICSGPTILADLGITDGLRATCYPGQEENMGAAIMQENQPCVTDGRLITGTSAGCAIPFGLALVEALKGKDVADKILGKSNVVVLDVVRKHVRPRINAVATSASDHSFNGPSAEDVNKRRS